MTQSRWTSRKFWVMMGTAGLTSGLLLYGSLDQTVWQWVMSVTVASYMAGNGIEALANGKKKNA